MILSTLEKTFFGKLGLKKNNFYIRLHFYHLKSGESSAVCKKLEIGFRENFSLDQESFLENLDFNNRRKTGIEDNNYKIYSRLSDVDYNLFPAKTILGPFVFTESIRHRWSQKYFLYLNGIWSSPPSSESGNGC